MPFDSSHLCCENFLTEKYNSPMESETLVLMPKLILWRLIWKIISQLSKFTKFYKPICKRWSNTQYPILYLDNATYSMCSHLEYRRKAQGRGRGGGGVKSILIFMWGHPYWRWYFFQRGGDCSFFYHCG